MAGFGSAPTSPLPVVGVDIGPTWANKLNTAIAELQAIVTPRLGNSQVDLGTDAELKHGPRTVRLGAMYGRVVNGTPTIAVIGEYYNAGGAADDVMFVLPLAENDRLLEVSVWGEVAVATAWNIALYSFNPLAGGFAQVGGTGISSTAPGRSKVTITGLAQTVATPTYYSIRWLSLAANNKVRAVEFKFDKVAVP